MSRRPRSAGRNVSALSKAIQGAHPGPGGKAREGVGYERLESRLLFSAAFDVTQVTNLRADPNFSNINGKGIGIAVLDTGVFAQNPDLQSNVVAFYDAVEQPATAKEDPNFIQDAFDHEGHGSHVSGIAASPNPAIGVAYGASLIDIRVFADPGENSLGGDPVDRGLRWVTLHASQYNIKVVNMSLGQPGVNLNFAPALDQEGADIQTLESMGITVVTSSGNSYANDPTLGASIPAVESTISVANTWASTGAGSYNFSAYYGGSSSDQFFAQETSAQPDIFAATSQRSSLFNQVAAPGQDIFSTWNSPAQLHNTLSGTSMSAPFVSGTVALMQQAALQFGGRYLAPSEVLQALRTSADTIVDSNVATNNRAQILADGSLGPAQNLPETGQSFDRVNVYKAVQQTKLVVQNQAGPFGDVNNSTLTSINTTPLDTTNTVNEVGSIGTDGSIFVGSNDIDIYKITLKAEGNLSIVSSAVAGSVQINLALRLFDQFGNAIGSPIIGGSGSYPIIATIPGQPLPVGTYYVGVSSQGNVGYFPPHASGIGGGTGQGGYQLTITLNNPDPHGVPASGETLDVRSPNTLVPTAGVGNLPAVHVSGTLGLETAPDGTTVTVPDGDVHFYKVIAPDNGTFNIQADADVTVFDQNNATVGSEGSNLVIPVVGGQTYFVGVTTQANAGFDPINPFTRVPGSTSPPTPYDLFVGFTNGDRNGTIPQATVAAVGTPVTQQIGTDNGAALLGANNGYKDIDFYAFIAPSSGVFDATASGASGFVPEMSFWTSTNGVSAVQRLADAGEINPQLFQQVTAGQTVYVAVTGKGNQNFTGIADGSGAGGQLGTYTLNTTIDPLSALATLSNNSIRGATPTPLPLGQPVPANIGRDGNLIIGTNDIDIYSFTAPATREYKFSTDTSQDGSAQTAMRVFDANGNEVAANQSSGPTTTNSVVTLPMTAGQTYYIGISGVGPNAFNYAPLNGSNTAGGSTGPYTVTAADVGAFQRSAPLQQGQNASYTDAAGHKITVTLTGPGLAQLVFNSPTGGSDLSQLLINGSDSTTTVTVRGAATPLGGVIVNGSLKSFTANTANLVGDLSVSGGLNTLQLSTASGGHSITIGSGGKLNATLGTLTDVSLVSAEPIASIRATQWNTSSATRYRISAGSLASLTVRGSFNEDVAVDTIGQMSVGSLVGSQVRANVSIASISAGSAQDSDIFAGVQSGVTALPASAADFANMTSAIKSVTVRGAFSNSQIAGWNITNVTLNHVITANGGTPFGIAANSLKHLRAAPDNGKPITSSNLFAPLAVQPLGGDAFVRLIG